MCNITIVITGSLLHNSTFKSDEVICRAEVMNIKCITDTFHIYCKSITDYYTANYSKSIFRHLIVPAVLSTQCHIDIMPFAIGYLPAQNVFIPNFTLLQYIFISIAVHAILPKTSLTQTIFDPNFLRSKLSSIQNVFDPNFLRSKLSPTRLVFVFLNGILFYPKLSVCV